MDAVIGLDQWTVLPGLAGFEVVAVERDVARGVLRVTVTPTEGLGLCPHCRRATGKRHECYDREVVDLPPGAWVTELVVKGFPFYCQRCDTFSTPRPEALAPSAHATERFPARLAELVGHGDVASAARFFAIPQKTAREWYYAYVQRAKREKAAAPGPVLSLGIDELSLKKNTASSSAC